MKYKIIEETAADGSCYYVIMRKSFLFWTRVWFGDGCGNPSGYGFGTLESANEYLKYLRKRNLSKTVVMKKRVG